MSCLQQDVSLTPPTVKTHAVRVHVIADTVYRAAAAGLGWTAGVPNLDVTISNDDSAATPVTTVRTDSRGFADLGTLPVGQYIVAATRLLSDAERRAAGSDIEGYVTHNRVRLGMVDTTSITLFASRRGSLLTSEWSFEETETPDGFTGYDFGGFLELYNSGDTTVFLDSLLIVAGFDLPEGVAPRHDCAYDAAHLQSPTGIWAWHVERFPGRGKDYRVAPGKTVVIATDAIDHRPLFVNQLDLSHADFEFGGAGGVLNPSVPTMIDLGLNPVPQGHGFYFGGVPFGVPVIARPVDVESLPKDYNVQGNIQYRKIPLSAVISVFAFRPRNLPPAPFADELCARIIDETILADDAALPFSWDPHVTGTQSVNRRVLYTRADGRKVLVNTRSSSADLVLDSRTPGWIP